MNEREHITSEDYDNEDRGSLDNEEQSYDRTVKYSQGRSGSLPPRRFQDRSSYFDWSSSAPRSQYFESSAYAKEGGGQLANAPWTELEHQRQLQQRAEADQVTYFYIQRLYKLIKFSNSPNKPHTKQWNAHITKVMNEVNTIMAAIIDENGIPEKVVEEGMLMKNGTMETVP